MEEAILCAALFTVLALLVLSMRRRGLEGKNRPPSPPSLPVVGHLHLLRGPLHHTMCRLAGRYGPVISLRLGCRPVLLISSPSAAEECFTKNDLSFANRPDTLGARILGLDGTAMIFTPHGQHWRNMRRIAAVELLSPRPLSVHYGIRVREVSRLISRLAQGVDGEGRAAAVLRPRVFEMAYSMVSEAITGDDREARSEDARWFSEIEREALELMFAFNPLDFFPFLKPIDVKGLKGRMVRLRKEVDAYYVKMVEEYKRRKEGGRDGAMETGKTMLGILLSLQQEQPQYYTDDILKGLILVFMTGGTHSMTDTIQSAMLFLLCHPMVLEKARAEIDMHVGTERLIDESDIPKLPYLSCIMQETIRLSPPSYGIAPHESSQDCTVQGFHVPRGTMLLVNRWGMQRDPSLWDEPTKFKPERFADAQGGGKKDFNFLPFGHGRRSCPGEAMSMRIVPFALGALIQCFNWESVGEEEAAAAMTANKPLVAAYKMRASMVDSIAQL